MIILDVAIGLIFLFVILGLFLSIFQELVASILGTRARTLKTAIRRLFETANGQCSLFKMLNEHPFLRQISANPLVNFPSYLPASRFVPVVIDIVERHSGTPGQLSNSSDPLNDFRAAIAKLPEGGFKTSLETVVNALSTGVFRKQEQMQALRDAIGQWYDQSMDRAAGWYRRRTRYFVFAYALAISVMLNVDTIHVARTLNQDPQLAKAIADTAAQYVDQIEENENASGYLIFGGALTDTLLLIAAMPEDEWSDPAAVAMAIDESHREGLVFLRDHTMLTDDGDELDATRCNAIGLTDPYSARLTCLLYLLEAYTDEPQPSETGDEWLVHDKGVYLDAIQEAMRVLRNKSGLFTIDALTGALEEASFPIGWDQFNERLKAAQQAGGNAANILILQTILGIVLTALAASLGAPFWFDLLQKFVKLRGAGIIPARGADLSTDATTEHAARG